MTTITANSAAVGAATARASTKRTFWTRLMDAMIESRQRRAAIEIRRIEALRGEPKERLDYALLPFAGE